MGARWSLLQFVGRAGTIGMTSHTQPLIFSAKPRDAHLFFALSANVRESIQVTWPPLVRDVQIIHYKNEQTRLILAEG